ncbi:acyl-CoA/acyl-ACP dehydrogenase [Microbispora sp. RL4-1S]|uniref:Acyl-CoA/acyl-ACP dehydrogenase n=1 Tax=Microbispora oryzae TaxID=2806554 RepID=A0A940WEP2_9ACTN|nr:acyl-CoA dehydrogenase family protein [Microbispora oryzae]MBP2702767.1 acyl-CoA/acyl-ACP dehydrogenase [Microbispora oryzae]
MIELDDRLLVLRRYAREWGADLAGLALDLERSPELVHKHLDLPGVSFLSRTPIPAEYNPHPLVLDGHRFYGVGGLERVTFCEEFAAADVGMLLAAPGPSLSGVFVALLGDERQKEWFFGRLLERPTWTFFALTEPERGSDAGSLRSALRPAPDGETLLLDGAKRFIGNAARADLGVVFARTRPGPLGVVAALVETAQPGFRATPFPTVGLRGNQVSQVTLDGVEVPAGRVLGRHLSPTRRGLAGAVRGFNRLRPGVAALGVGIARGAYEYVLANRRSLTAGERADLDAMGRGIEGVRQLVRRAALAIDHDDPALGYLASAAKARAARLAEEVTLRATGFFGAGARLEHPLLDKFVRDARGVEYMEGTRNIQRLNVFQGLTQGRLPRG